MTLLCDMIHAKTFALCQMKRQALIRFYSTDPKARRTMNLAEMHSIASDTLEYFIRTMPDVPFIVDDVVIEFAPKAKMAQCARALCAQFVPGKTINESQARELTEGIDANALIGKGKSAVIACVNSKRSAQAWREVFFMSSCIFTVRNWRWTGSISRSLW